MTWDEDALKELRSYLAEGALSYRGIGKLMGCSRVAIAGAVRRYIHLIPDARPPELRRRPPEKRSPRKQKRQTEQGRWTEHALTETWAERKAKRALECR